MEHLDLDIQLDRGDFRLSIKESLDLSGITAIFGPNGSGKTSLLRVIAGLETGAQGSVRFGSTVWQDSEQSLPPEARAVGFVFQDGRLFPHLDVRGNLNYPLKHGKRTGPIGFDDTVAALKLESLLDRNPAALSGGERQRVAMARALLANPALMLMDEPLSSLDRVRKRELIGLIRTLPNRFNMPIFYVTHDVDELVQLADHVLLLANGRRVGRGSAREMLEHSDFEEMSELGDPGVILEGRVVAHTDALTLITLGEDQLRIPRATVDIGQTVRLRVHARDVILALERPSKLSIRNTLTASIRAIEPRTDGQVSVLLAIGEQRLKARITADAAEELELHTGLSVLALIKSVALDSFSGG